MSKGKKKATSIMVFILVISIVLGGCGDDKKKANENKASKNDVSVGEITSGGSVTVGITQDLDSLDPHRMAYAGTREVLFNVFEGLVKPDSKGDLKPAVAANYQISEDATVYTFTLRDGIKFHDGTTVTAEDIKYSIDRYADFQDEESAFSIVKEVRITDKKTIEVHLTEGNSEFLAELTLAIIPEHNTNPDTNPIGTGPFLYESFQPGQKFVVKKFTDYWLENCPYLDQVTFKIVADTDAAMLELKANTLDVYQYLTSDQAAELADNFNILQGSVNYVQGLFLNHAYEPFHNLKVRQAMNYAVDKDAINQFIFEGKSHIIGTNMIPAFEKYYEPSTKSTYEHNVEKAKEYLKEAGYENGFDLVITVPNNYKPHATVAEVIVENLKEVGIRATIELVEFTTWHSEAYMNRNYQATVVAVDGTLAPNSWFTKNYSKSENNFTNYSNVQYDAKYEAALKTVKEEEKIAAYKELQKILSEDAASVYIQDPANLVAVNKNLQGYVFYPVAAQDMSLVGYTEE